eukprot:TRINITY_DN41304_c0_g1_i7.p1 TRINITY_DN41304_c0_g1~~TRINITY_DN41304_c0_g1_i7.p1  ORF type:complete len:391 (-),score=18.38 TRINITY_DN41304_c0_g1_i7:236-1408(-)
MTPPQCLHTVTRIWHNECYCPLGTFYAATLYADEDEQCAVRGLDVWHVWYSVYATASFCGFLSLLVWCTIRLVVLLRQRGRKLQKMIHLFVFLAKVDRVLYMLAEIVTVHGVSRSVTDYPTLSENVAQATYTSFFPLSAAAFLCVCQYWLRLMYIMNEVEERPWYRKPLYVVCVALFVMEGLYALCYVWARSAVIDSLYFFWLSMVSVLVALTGATIARRVYRTLRMWIADDNSVIFRKVLVSAGLSAGFSIVMLVVSISWALCGRFYAWPCLICSALQRMTEIAYVALILGSTARLKQAQPATIPHRSESFASNMSFNDPEDTPAGIEAFWIGVADFRFRASTSESRASYRTSSQGGPYRSGASLPMLPTQSSGTGTGSGSARSSASQI